MAIKRICLREALAFLSALLPILLFSTASHSEVTLCERTDLTAIHTIQGTDSVSPEKGEKVLIEGLVTKKVTTFSEENRGLFLQAPKGKEDHREDTSEGIFVTLAAEDMEAINENDLLRVEGTVSEKYYQTHINPVTGKEVCKKAADHHLKVKDRSLPKDTILQKWQNGDDSMERYEGMKLTFTGTIIRSYSYDYGAYRNNMVLGKAVEFKPTQLYRPGEKADKLNKSNQDNRIVLEEGDYKKNGDIGYYPQFNPNEYPLRIGSTVTDIPVVIGYGYGKFFMVAVGQWERDTVTDPSAVPYKRELTAPARPPGYQRAVSMNVLNLFTDDGVEDAPKSAGDNRGATNSEDFYLQRLKIVTAIDEMDADLLGLLEVGNNGDAARSAIVDLVEALNSSHDEPLPGEKDERYRFIFPDTDRIGTDAITVGIIYRPSVFSPEGKPVILEMPKEVSKDAEGKDEIIGQRDAMAQKFCLAGVNEICMTVVVSHFKSKRCSGCKDDPADVGKTSPIQGCCNNLRVSASVRLGEYVKPLIEADEKVLLLGDFNAYGEEDPVYVLTATEIPAIENVRVSSVANIPGVPGFDKKDPITRGYGMVNPAKELDGTKVFSYSYDAELGSLDHVLTSSNLKSMIHSVSDWHINSLENSFFEYSGKYSGTLPKSAGPFSCSDHDPVIVDFNLQ